MIDVYLHNTTTRLSSSRRCFTQDSPPLITLSHITRTFSPGGRPLAALRDVSLQIHTGEFVVITGPSGSGKSTLLHLIGGLDQPSSGQISVDGVPLHSLTQDGLARWRSRRIGIVFQFFQLLPTLTLLENVLLPMELSATRSTRARRERARQLLAEVGLAERADAFPAQASGGEQQRAAIARALANDPALMLADEPTGNLDSASAAIICDLFAALVARGHTLLLATHDASFNARADRIVHLRDGAIVPGE